MLQQGLWQDFPVREIQRRNIDLESRSPHLNKKKVNASKLFWYTKWRGVILKGGGIVTISYPPIIKFPK